MYNSFAQLSLDSSGKLISVVNQDFSYGVLICLFSVLLIIGSYFLIFNLYKMACKYYSDKTESRHVNVDVLKD